jgi:hypothetical protein
MSQLFSGRDKQSARASQLGLINIDMVPKNDLWGGEADGGVAIGGSGREGADATGGVGGDVFGRDAVGGEVFGDVARASKGEAVVDFGGSCAAIGCANDFNFQAIFDSNSGNFIEVDEL